MSLEQIFPSVIFVKLVSSIPHSHIDQRMKISHNPLLTNRIILNFFPFDYERVYLLMLLVRYLGGVRQTFENVIIWLSRFQNVNNQVLVFGCKRDYHWICLQNVVLKLEVGTYFLQPWFCKRDFSPNTPLFSLSY